MLGWLKLLGAHTGLSQLSLERGQAFAAEKNLSYPTDPGASQ